LTGFGEKFISFRAPHETTRMRLINSANILGPRRQ
jgi:hypothetical protein